MDAFEILFRQADGDGDGKISGAEAVSFFRATGLPQITLAKIWQLSDQSQRGFLTKPEFDHALKLVTVAQSGRELTPEIARAALSGPAASQIPPPRLSAPPPPQPQQHPYNRPQAPVPQQVPQFRPQAPPGLQNQRVSFTGQPSRPQTLPSFQQQPFPQQQTLPPFPQQQHQVQPQVQLQQAQPQAAQSQQWRPASQDSFGGSTFQAVPPKPPKPETPPSSVSSSVSSTAASAPLSADVFGSDAFKASSTPGRAMLPEDFGSEAKALVPVTTPAPTPTSVSASTAIVPASPPAPAPTPVQSFRPPAPVPFSQAQAFPQPAPAPGFTPSFPSVQPVASPPGAGWPRMTQADVERYTQVFVGVDTDRDGKIRGDQARDLFLSWRLPRDVLKQIWDLSDQDGDSMLSLREFCIALYFMERFREGRPVPPVLPAGFLPEAPAPQPWQAGFSGPPGPGGFPTSPGSLSPGVMPSQSAGLMPVQATPADTPTGAQSIQYKSRVAPLELELVNQLSMEDQSTLKAKQREAEDADRKVFELDKEIKSAGEMIEFYRAKLQEIILFKTRADNQRLELTERLAADKREIEGLRKKYDLKFQQAGEANSRLQAEEVAFRDIQQRKMELYNAIAKIDQAKGADLQTKAEQISDDLNELRTLLSQRAKSLGLRAKPTSAMELPFGWQPGVQESSADWSQSWTTFEDNGYDYFHRTEEPKASEVSNWAVASEKPVEKPKPDEEPAEANGHAEEKSLENGAAEAKQPEPPSPEKQTSSEKPKPDEDEAEDKNKERESSPAPAPPSPAPSSSWASVFGDEPVWNLSQDFGSMGLKSIKTSAPQRGGDASVPETPLFSSGEPETPLFSSSSLQAENQQQQASIRAGDESMPETPLFKSPDDSRSRNAFARFDSFGEFGHFDDASAAPGASSTSQAWSTF